MKLNKLYLLAFFAVPGAIYANPSPTVETKWSRTIPEECGAVVDVSGDTGVYGIGGIDGEATPVTLNIFNNVQNRGFTFSALNIDETEFDGYQPNFIIEEINSGISKPVDGWLSGESFTFEQKQMDLYSYTSSSSVDLPSESATLKVTWQVECE